MKKACWPIRKELRATRAEMLTRKTAGGQQTSPIQWPGERSDVHLGPSDRKLESD